MHYTAQHSLLSVSYCSNIPGFTEPECLVRSAGEEGLEVARLVCQFVDRLLECAAEASRRMRFRYRHLLEEIDCEVERLEELEKQYKEKRSRNRDQQLPGHNQKQKKSCALSLVKQQFERWLDTVPVVGFNSQRYDLNV